MSTLDFDEPSHVYRLDGRVIPSVTQILAPLVDYSMVKPEVLERARQLGQAVHRATELYDNDDLDEDTLSDEVYPYLIGWQKFRRECGFVPLLREARFAHPSLGFAGTLDTVGPVKGELAVIDLKKMATLGPVVGVQTAAYKELCVRHGFNVITRYGLSLRQNSYQLIPYTGLTDWHCFVSLLTLHNWKQKHGQQR